jgi:protein-S-isoprenylcysteine O-methyltransferase Ste14
MNSAAPMNPPALTGAHAGAMTAAPTPAFRDADLPARADAAALPRSAQSFAAGLVGLGALLATFFAVRHAAWSTQDKVLALAAAIAVPIGLIDLVVHRVHRRESTGLDWTQPAAPSFARIATKLIGLAVTIGVIALGYWLLPEYHGSFYEPYFALVRRLAPGVAIAAALYFSFIDGRMREPRDVYWQLGRCVLGCFRDADRRAIANHALAWLVKAFFVPLMIVYAHTTVAKLCDTQVHDLTWAHLRLYSALYSAVFGIDLMFAMFGYVASLRLFDTHVRSAESTMLGWVVALLCYDPFYTMFAQSYVGSDGSGFGPWLHGVPFLRGVWAAAIILLVAIYALATVAFGWRFSNLTHRGILTSGPYRYTKHPAYLTKNLSWWLANVPFVAVGGPRDALRSCALMLILNVIYFLRARTEERHLSQDPTYVRYALWMNDHGALAWLGRIVPALRYTQARGRS